MKRLAGALVIAVALGAVGLMNKSCTSGPDDHTSTRTAQGPVKYGGVFRMNEIEDFRTLYPLNIVEVVGHHIGSQVYEGLVKFNQKDLSIVPALAYRWEASDSNKRYVFHLRKGVLFHDDECFAATGGKGRELTAADVKFTFDKLCTKSPNNQQFTYTFKDRVVGANEYFEATANGQAPAGGVSGVTVVDDSTIEIKLLLPMPGFLQILATQGGWVYPQEAFDKYGDDMRTHCVGTGPFKVKSIAEGESVILDYNPNYWMFDEHGNRLPYLDIVQFRFIKDKRSEIIAFRNNELDMVFRLPVEMAKDILGELDQAKEHGTDFVMQTAPAMSLTYYGFQHQLEPFNNQKVRLAFNYAINRDEIADKKLMGDAIPGKYGIVPPSIIGYNADSVHGYTYDPDLARKYLAEAGYPGGKGFPEITLRINSGGGDRNTITADYVAHQLNEVLGITVKVETIPFAQHLESIETGKSLFWRTGWIADYPDPETFLTTLYSKHIPTELNSRSSTNSVRYSNPRFDSLYNAAVHEADPVKRADLFLQADRVQVEDGAIMPIYYEQNDRLLQRNVRNFDINAMEFRDMTKVWLDVKEPAAGTTDTTKK
jgi:peptide/nickel transport system substrate-binding protein